jgi:hypothetical protein
LRDHIISNLQATPTPTPTPTPSEGPIAAISQSDAQAISRKLKVTLDGSRKYVAWIGASILGSLSMFDLMVMKKEQYEEVRFFVCVVYCSIFKLMVNSFVFATGRTGSGANLLLTFQQFSNRHLTTCKLTLNKKIFVLNGEDARGSLLDCCLTTLSKS